MVRDTTRKTDQNQSHMQDTNVSNVKTRNSMDCGSSGTRNVANSNEAKRRQGSLPETATYSGDNGKETVSNWRRARSVTSSASNNKDENQREVRKSVGITQVISSVMNAPFERLRRQGGDTNTELAGYEPRPQTPEPLSQSPVPSASLDKNPSQDAIKPRDLEYVSSSSRMAPNDLILLPNSKQNDVYSIDGRVEYPVKDVDVWTNRRLPVPSSRSLYRLPSPSEAQKLVHLFTRPRNLSLKFDLLDYKQPNEYDDNQTSNVDSSLDSKIFERVNQDNDDTHGNGKILQLPLSKKQKSTSLKTPRDKTPPTHKSKLTKKFTS